MDLDQMDLDQVDLDQVNLDNMEYIIWIYTNLK